ncbi:MAG: L-threonylcarbamoyladenylate synthase [Vicinamibacterales bacterium]
MTPRRVRATRVVVVDPNQPAPEAVALAADVIRAGGLVAFPTETVYGLGAAALDAAAVAGIFDAKERPATDPLIVHVAAPSDLAAVSARVPPAAQALAARFWPGPLTLVVPRAPSVPAVVAAGLDTLAVRVPDHPVARAILEAAAVPVAAPSANRFSRPSPTTAAHVLADLDGRIDLVVDAGPTSIGVESTIVDCVADPPVVRRAGGVPIEALARVVPDVAAALHVAASPAEAQVAPGQLLRHYAPAARLTAFSGAPDAVAGRLARDARQQVGAGVRLGILAPDEVLVALAPAVAAAASGGRVVVESLGPWRRPEAAARALFAALRRLDDAGVHVILAAGPEPLGLGAAVWDRLRRAAEGRIVVV